MIKTLTLHGNVSYATPGYKGCGKEIRKGVQYHPNRYLYLKTKPLLILTNFHIGIRDMYYKGTFLVEMEIFDRQVEDGSQNHFNVSPVFRLLL